ncbi:MAG: TetR/AcrR family transcriptional regulator [Alphaproteobacteria bacterium]|nr:TetR/AcrR family transcriptional regulator [Alphaproteobacteria bacterium]
MDKEDKRKQDILDGAFSYLMKHGLPTLSYNAIARKAGVSRQLIRYYYAEPEDLMVALCDHLASLYRDGLVNGVLEVQPEDRLKFFFDFYFDLLENAPKPRDDQVYDAMMSLAAGSPVVRTNLQKQYGLIGQVVAHEIHLKYPQIGSEGADELSYLFVCLMYGHWKMVASLGLDEVHKHVTRRAIDRLIESYGVDSAPAQGKVKIWNAGPEN